MILEFSIANFLSFKHKVTFSMIANATNGLDDNYIIFNDRKVLKTNAIYGANASGKSNVLKAFEFYKRFVTESFKNSQAGEAIDVENFRLNATHIVTLTIH